MLSGSALPFLAFLPAPQTRSEGIAQGISQTIKATHIYFDVLLIPALLSPHFIVAYALSE